MKRDRREGFTLVELLVVIAIIGVMLATTIPAIQASREVGRRTLCHANLAQLMLAVRSYQDAFESLPAGVLNPDGPIRSEAHGRHQGWIIRLLPYFDEGNVYRAIDQAASVYDPANADVRKLSLSAIVCPSEPNEVRGISNYAGCHHDVEAPIAADNHGVLFLNSQVRREDITDGLGHTIFLGEKRADVNDLGWMSGTRATLRNTALVPNAPISQAAAEPAYAATVEGPEAPNPVTALTYVGGFASAHPGGLHVGFGDASVKYIHETIDPQVWQLLANRADGKPLDVNLAED